MANTRNRRKKKHRKMTAKERIISASVIVIGLAAVFLMGGKMLMDWKPMDRLGAINNDLPDINSSDSDSKEDDGKDEADNDGFVNILCMGFDEDETRTDVIMLVSLNKSTNAVNILQIPRDTYVDMSETGKINDVFEFGGDEPSIQNVVKVINEKFYLSVDHYMTIGCGDIVDIVDNIGGVPIDVPEKIIYEGDKIIYAGEQTLTGEQAEWFVRYRKAYAMGDLGRAQTQRVFLAACMKKAQDLGVSQVLSLVPTVYQNMNTDMSIGQMKEMAELFLKVDMTNCTMHMLPGESVEHGLVNEYDIYLMHKQEIANLLNQYFRDATSPVSAENLDIKDTDYYGIDRQTDAFDDDSSNFGDIIDGEDVPNVPRRYLEEYDIY